MRRRRAGVGGTKSGANERARFHGPPVTPPHVRDRMARGNVGCIWSRALLRTAGIAHLLRTDADTFGS